MNAVKIGMTIEEAAECTGIGRNTMRSIKAEIFSIRMMSAE